MSWLRLSIILLAVLIGPFFTITAINTLFGLGIDVNVGTWFAMAWIHIVFASTTKHIQS